MRVKIATLMLYMFCIIHVNAQQKTDGFFNYQYQGEERGYNFLKAAKLNCVYGVDITNMEIEAEPASLGSGLLVLSVISTSYLAIKRKEGKK